MENSREKAPWELEIESLPTYLGSFPKGRSPWDLELARRRTLRDLAVAACIAVGIDPSPRPKLKYFSRKKRK